MEPESPEVIPQETPAVVENTTQAQTVTETESIEQINWRKFREAREQDRRSAEESKKRAEEKEREATALKAALEAVLNKPNVSSRNGFSEETYDDNETEEQRINKIIEQKMAERDRKLSEERMKIEAEQALPNAMKAFPDFKDIYNESNCDYLEFHHPELFASLKREPDSFDKWSKVYNAMKRYIPNPNSKKQESKIEKNFSKPQSMSVSGATSTGDQAPIHLSDQKRQDNWKRMQMSMRRAS